MDGNRTAMILLLRRAALPLALAAAAFGAGAARADSLKQCSARYQAAKNAGTLNNQDWKSFRKSQCAGTASVADAAPAAGPSAAPAGAPPAAAAPASAPTSAPAPSAPAHASGGAAVFPSAVNAKYASLTPGKARMKTCLDQYHANKGDGGNGGLKWIQKGGGYYSACSRHLKGA